MESIEGRKRAKAFSAVALAAVLGATLWPLNPLPRNGITVLGRNGLKFEKGLLVSNEPLKLPPANAFESYSLELLVRPSVVDSSSTILAFYNPALSKQLLIRQLKDGFALAEDSEIERDRVINCEVSGIFHPGQLIFIAISSGPDETSMYVDGHLTGSFPGQRISRNELSGDILVGTSPLTYQPWSGGVQGLAIYANALTPQDAFQHYQAWMSPGDHHPDLDNTLARYTFSQATGPHIRNEVAAGPNLVIPPVFSVPHKAFLRSPGREFRPDWRYTLNVISNIAGFVPLGLIVCSYLDWTESPWKAAIITVVFCGLLSFMIEVAQYYVPRRGSGVTDIITNTLGAAVGAGLLQLDRVRRRLAQMNLARM